MGNKKFVSLYVNEALANELELNKDKEQVLERLIKEKVIKNTSEAAQEELKYLNNQLLEFRGILSLISQKYEEAYCEEIRKTNDFWEEINKGLPHFSKRVVEITKKITPISNKVKNISQDIRELDEQLCRINYHRLESLNQAIETFKGLSSDEKNIIALLLNKE